MRRNVRRQGAGYMSMHFCHGDNKSAPTVYVHVCMTCTCTCIMQDLLLHARCTSANASLQLSSPDQRSTNVRYAHTCSLLRKNHERELAGCEAVVRTAGPSNCRQCIKNYKLSRVLFSIQTESEAAYLPAVDDAVDGRDLRSGTDVRGSR